MIFSLNFPGFYVTLKISPLTTKSRCFIYKYKYKMTILFSDLRKNSSLFSLIVALLCGVHA